MPFQSTFMTTTLGNCIYNLDLSTGLKKIPGLFLHRVWYVSLAGEFFPLLAQHTFNSSSLPNIVYVSISEDMANLCSQVRIDYS